MMNQDRNGATSLQARYLRPDAGRYIRPDALRFIRPDVARILARGRATADGFPGIDLKFRADQRRIPAGQPGGGRWTDILAALIWGLPSATNSEDDEDDGPADGDEEDESDRRPSTGAEAAFRNAYASDGARTDVVDNSVPSVNTDVLLDAEAGEIILVGGRNELVVNEFGEPYYKLGGHHEMPRAVYEQWDLAPATRQVFDRSTTGSLPRGMVSGPDGEFRGHYWDREHRAYSDSVMDLSDKFLKENNITDTRQMTPDQARDLLAEIRNSDDPKIKDYNRAMRYIGRIFRSGGGRGSQ